MGVISKSKSKYECCSERGGSGDGVTATAFCAFVLARLSRARVLGRVGCWHSRIQAKLSEAVPGPCAHNSLSAAGQGNVSQAWRRQCLLETPVSGGTATIYRWQVRDCLPGSAGMGMHPFRLCPAHTQIYGTCPKTKLARENRTQNCFSGCNVNANLTKLPLAIRTRVLKTKSYR